MTRRGEVEDEDLWLPDLACLHLKHQGLTEAVCASYAEAAAVCLSRHHVPPVLVDMEIPAVPDEPTRETRTRRLTWQPPSERAVHAWGNRDDATRDGAYCVCLSVVEAELGLVAFERADVKTGADYYVGPPDTPDLETAFRLEVSGLDQGNRARLRARLKEKEDEARRGLSELPAIAGVVGFREHAVFLSQVSDDNPVSTKQPTTSRPARAIPEPEKWTATVGVNDAE